MFNYPRIKDAFEPFLDPAHAQEKGTNLLDWISGYFDHGDTVETLEQLHPMDDPAPTLRNVAPEELPNIVCFAPASPDGTDQMLVVGAHRSGFFGELWKQAFEIPEGAKDEWRDLEFRLVWCDRSMYVCVHGAWGLQAEVGEAREKGRSVRDVKFTRIRGGNHFVSILPDFRDLAPATSLTSSFSRPIGIIPKRQLRRYLEMTSRSPLE